MVENKAEALKTDMEKAEPPQLCDFQQPILDTISEAGNCLKRLFMFPFNNQ